MAGGVAGSRGHGHDLTGDWVRWGSMCGPGAGMGRPALGTDGRMDRRNMDGRRRGWRFRMEKAEGRMDRQMRRDGWKGIGTEAWGRDGRTEGWMEGEHRWKDGQM